MADVSDYTGLITSEHAGKPKFMAMVAAVAGAFVDAQAFLEHLPIDFDLDTAIGAQLDVLGLWIGIPRRIAVPIANVYFSWDTASVGWDEGIWKGTTDPSATITVLDDDTYRLVLRAKIGANNWDGSVITAGPILSAVFGNSGTTAQITDNGDMSFDVHLAGTPPSALEQALLAGGYIPIKPAGVEVNYHLALALDGSFSLDGTELLDGLS